ncbi:MAG: hypothetical protein AAF532_13135 [Planctomycetota bacterium]
MKTTCFGSSVAKLLCVPAFLAAIPGCGGSGVPTVPVSGIVTVDGAPAENVSVYFRPTDVDEDTLETGPRSQGITDTSGRFQLRIAKVNGSPGAVVGNHAVVISNEIEQIVDDEGGVIDERIIGTKLPKDGEKKRTFVVPEGGTTEANFEF